MKKISAEKNLEKKNQDSIIIINTVPIHKKTMNITINDKLAYYLPFIFKLGNIQLTDEKEYLSKIRSLSQAELLKVWKAALKENLKPEEDTENPFKAHIAVSLAVFFAIQGDLPNCSEFLRLIQLKMGHPVILEIIRCILYCQTTQFDDGLKLLDNFPVEMASHPFVLRLKADIFFAMKDYDKAEILYKKVANKVPDPSNIFCRLGEIYLLRDQIDIAKELLLCSVKLNNKNIMAHLYLGDVYKLKNEIESAKMEYGICSAIDLDNDISKMAQQKLFLIHCEKEKKEAK
ncbi:MAG: hypothetical protein PHF84_07720 [bacterium]|nr:hypothetical protein [bacterium]